MASEEQLQRASVGGIYNHRLRLHIGVRNPRLKITASVIES